MKQLRPLLSAGALVLSAATAFAQTNSVALKNGSGTLLSQYNSIAGAYAAIPATLTQPYTIEVDTSYTAVNETFPIVFTNKAGASSTNTITVTVVNTSTTKRIQTTVPSTASGMFVLDDADWIIFDGKADNFNRGWDMRSDGQLISLVNGASNNTIRNCSMSGLPWSTIGVLLGTSATNSSGNSNNIVESSFVSSCKKAIASEGTVTNPNRNNRIKSNVIFPNHTAFRAGAGTGKTHIDSNFVSIWSNDSLGYAGFMIDSLADTVFVNRNTIFMQAGNVPNHTTAPARGIYVKAGNSTNFAIITNNIIHNNARMWVDVDDTSLIWAIDNKANLAGIEFAGATKVRADVFHNTIVLDGLLAPTMGISGNVASAAFLRSETNSSSIYNIKNNIFLNTRTGGVTGAIHAALSLIDASNVSIDYNIYNNASNQFLARISTTNYSNLASYKALYTNGNEAQSDSIAMSFVSDEDYHLNSTMYGNTAIYGTPSGLTTDIENHPRTIFYRGADEFVVSCAAPLQKPRIIYNPHFVCRRSTRRLELAGGTEINGVDHQWQMRAAGSNAPFIDITDEKSRFIFFKFTTPTEIRVKDSCISGGSVVYSDTVNIQSFVPTADSIVTFQVDSAAVLFSLASPKNIHTIEWSFGDGTGNTKDSVTHRYLNPGTYTVTVVLRNLFCGDDTVSFQKTVTIDFDTSSTGLSSIPGNNGNIRLYPNPANTKLQAEVLDQTPYAITDLTGRHVQSGTVIAETIYLEELPAGSYIISFTAEDGKKLYSRFVKQ